MDRRPARPRATARVLDQYLQRHAEPEARETTTVSRAFPRVAVVPALGEGESLDRAIESIRVAGGGEALVIVVLNARESDPPAVHAANAAARARLRGDDLLVIDRASPGRWIPEKQGVGLARKIGTDVAVALRAAGRVASRWIHHTDADAEVPADWFAGAEAAPDDAVALTFPFRHRPEAGEAGTGAASETAGAALAEQVALYELWLRYHRLGLAAAGSPYAVQAIGSTMVTDADAVVLARGWPRTMAGEDFYLLDKLAKLGVVRRVAGGPIVLAGRPSTRVPFGTGRALIDMAARGESSDSWQLMNPAAYDALSVVLRALDAARVGGAAPLDAALAENPAVAAAVGPMGLGEFVARSVALRLPADVLMRRLHTWFDAFRTLRFLHTLRDGSFPPRSWRPALDAAPFLQGSGLPAAREVSVADALARLQAIDETASPAVGVPLVVDGAPRISAITDCR
jgi:hypothetical protein